MRESKTGTNTGLFVLGVSMASLLNVSFAGTYKWTDEDGVVHYSQQPPPGEVDVTEIAPPPAVDSERAVRELEADQEKLHKLQEARKEEQIKQAEEERVSVIAEQNCRNSREKLNRLENSGRVRAVDEEGNVTRISEEEHQARIDTARSNVEKYCK